jgi:hypothetical protein
MRYSNLRTWISVKPNPDGLRFNDPFHGRQIQYETRVAKRYLILGEGIFPNDPNPKLLLDL